MYFMLKVREAKKLLFVVDVMKGDAEWRPADPENPFAEQPEGFTPRAESADWKPESKTTVTVEQEAEEEEGDEEETIKPITEEDAAEEDETF